MRPTVAAAAPHVPTPSSTPLPAQATESANAGHELAKPPTSGEAEEPPSKRARTRPPESPVVPEQISADFSRCECGRVLCANLELARILGLTK